MPGRPPQHLPKRLSQLSPQPRRAWNVRQLSDSMRRRRWRSQNKGPRKSQPSKSHGGGQHGRPQKEAAAVARAERTTERKARKLLQQQRQESEFAAVRSGGPPLGANSSDNAVALPLQPRASGTECFEFRCVPWRRFQTWFRQKALPGQKFMRCAWDMRRALRFPQPTSIPEVRVWLFALVGYWWWTPYGRDALGYELLVPDPDWHRIGSCLRLSASGPRAGMSGVRRRGNGISKPGAVSTH